MRAELRQAIKAAGDIALHHFGQTTIEHADSKALGDFVSYVDRRVQDELITRLRYAFPDHHFIGEEDSAVTTSATTFNAAAVTTNQQQPHWIIDPIDGTTNFLRGIPAWCLSVCFCDAIDQPKIAAIFDPVHNDLFEAERQAGAWKNGERMYSSGCTNPSAALWASALPFRYPAALSAVNNAFGIIQQRYQDLRRCGSAALDLAAVACGKIDAYWEPFIFPWDTAAGELLVREAGGTVSDMAGGTDGLLNRRSILAAASERLHQDLLGVCQPLAEGIVRDILSEERS